MIGHEVGQYTVYPDFREIGKYSGVLRARNFELAREKLRARGMLDQAEDFTRASGALAVICYREEIEAALRTPGFGGFQLLDLQDFPGQGTALVGVLNAFMESKGLVEPAAWREFCSPTVPLLRFRKYCWTAGEPFSAQAEVAHYGPADLAGVVPEWRLVDEAHRLVIEGKLPRADIRRRGLSSLGTLSVQLPDVKRAKRFTLCLSLPQPGGQSLSNGCPLWIYPLNKDLPRPKNVMVSHAWDAPTRAALAAGKRVLLLTDAKQPGSVEGGFATDFWCWPMFHSKPGTMGLLCDPKHPALAGFPTEFHSNWQWGEIACASRPIVLDETPADYRPIVQVIDNFDRCHKLGLIFECRVGAGKLLLCACDLEKLQDQPAAWQLLGSLLAYAASDRFDPPREIAVGPLVGEASMKDGSD